VEAIGNSGARFQSVSEPWADTTTHAGKMIMTIFAGIAEFERDLIRERTGFGGGGMSPITMASPNTQVAQAVLVNQLVL
jgi:hypothetical protein